MQDELETFQSHVQSRLDLNPQELLLTSFLLDARALMIVLKVEALFNRGHQVIFEGCFKNTNEGQMVSLYVNEVFGFKACLIF